MRISFLTPLAAVFAITAVPGSADAGWVPGNSGNTVVTAPDKKADGVINFAVYDNNDNSFAAYVAGKGGAAAVGANAAPATFGKYVYAYQIVNSNPSSSSTNPDVLALNIQVDPAAVKSFGQILNTTFTENVTSVAAVGTNTRLDGKLADGAFVAGAINLVDAGTVVDVGGAGGKAKAATDAFIADYPTGGMGLQFLARLSAGEYSTVVFFSTDTPPALDGGSILQGFLNANGTVYGPSAVPEPGTMALLALGLPLAGCGFRRLKGRAAQAPVTA